MKVAGKVISGNGLEITTGAIVGFKKSKNHSFCKGEQGQVLFPYSEEEGTDFTVAVYIPKECEKYINHRHQTSGENWKKKIPTTKKVERVRFSFQRRQLEKLSFCAFL